MKNCGISCWGSRRIGLIAALAGLLLHGRFPYLSYPRRCRREDRAVVRTALLSGGTDGDRGWLAVLLPIGAEKQFTRVNCKQGRKGAE